MRAGTSSTIPDKSVPAASGTHTEGVYLGGTDNYVLNSGDIAGGQYGILTEVEGYKNQIVNTGTISGSSIAIALTGIQGISGRPTSLSNLALDPSRYGIINHGDILGGSIGIYGVGPLKVVNSGLIDAGEFGVLITTDRSDASSLTNSGTIRANMAFLGGIGQDTVINTGPYRRKTGFQPRG